MDYIPPTNNYRGRYGSYPTQAEELNEIRSVPASIRDRIERAESGMLPVTAGQLPELSASSLDVLRSNPEILALLSAVAGGARQITAEYVETNTDVTDRERQVFGIRYGAEHSTVTTTKVVRKTIRLS